VLGDSINIVSQFEMEEATPAPPEITQRQVIRLGLRPGHPWDDGDETSFSMFGTDRTIKSFQLEIHPIADPAEQESCRAWGSVSYTTEIDFRHETSDDCSRKRTRGCTPNPRAALWDVRTLFCALQHRHLPHSFVRRRNPSGLGPPKCAAR
jgi:hypothetical protein